VIGSVRPGFCDKSYLQSDERVSRGQKFSGTSAMALPGTNILVLLNILYIYILHSIIFH